MPNRRSHILLMAILTMLLVFTGNLFSQQEITLKWECQDCHAASGWTPLAAPMTFDHDTQTNFVLTGAHRQTACRGCHLGNDVRSIHDFQRAPTACAGCHADLHGGRYGVNCEQCHRDDTWDMSYWADRHMETLFPLVGAHRGLACEACHGEGNYRIDPACANCHAADFDLTVASHAGFTRQADCSLCHGPTNWQDIMALNHDQFFPINSGEHAGVWSSCNSCHPTAGVYQEFTCFGSGCHNVTSMNAEHCEGNDCENCNGRTYPVTNVQPEDCYFCHPRGNENFCGD
ncbi:MAG: hypothetical protein K9N36_03775 [Candidatus Marinimicrobia bacterium]|nr:hypothetical protein [Candidatus Neomarinimicrobiota bacterium]